MIHYNFCLMNNSFILFTCDNVKACQNVKAFIRAIIKVNLTAHGVWGIYWRNVNDVKLTYKFWIDKDNYVLFPLFNF